MLDNTINNVINALDNSRFSKLICGASNTNKKQIERLTLVYSLAGVNVIDIAPDEEIFDSAKNGIMKAKEIFREKPHYFNNFNEPLLMVSLNAGKDNHFRKVKIDNIKCNNCFGCINICPAGAFSKQENILKFNENDCFGCGKCIEYCSFNALSIEQIGKNPEMTEILNNEIEAIEIHTGKCGIEEVKKFLEKISSIVNNVKILSFSINSALFNREQLIEYASSLAFLIPKTTIIQIDGESMSATNSNSSALQAIAAANILINSKINAYIQIAGGVNHLTSKYLNLFDLKVSGIGYGTFARKILLPYIEGFNDDEFFNYLPKCVNIATSLVKNTRKPGENSV